jgi:hypothetical protein
VTFGSAWRVPIIRAVLPLARNHFCRLRIPATQALHLLITPPVFRLLTRELIQTAQANGFVSTPGGFRQRSHVHLVRAGGIYHQAGRCLVCDELGDWAIDGQFRSRSRGSEPGGSDQGLDDVGELAEWDGHCHLLFCDQWIVPAAPTSPASQLVYFFNGLQNVGGTEILQPVLQWGSSGRAAGRSGESHVGTSTRRDTRIARRRRR